MMKELQFYCVACRKKVMCKKSDVAVIVYKNKKTGKTPALRCQGCPKCGTNMNKWIKPDKTQKLIEKYGEWQL